MIYLEYNKLFFPSPGYLQDFVFKRERERAVVVRNVILNVSEEKGNDCNYNWTSEFYILFAKLFYLKAFFFL